MEMPGQYRNIHVAKQSRKALPPRAPRDQPSESKKAAKKAAFCINIEAENHPIGIILTFMLCITHKEPITTMPMISTENSPTWMFERCSGERSMCRK